MRQSTRLILNTCATFARMLTTVGIGLLATRLLARLLGESDFGLYGVALAAVTILTTGADSLLTSATTHLAAEVGRARLERLRDVFATSVFLFATMAVTAMVSTLALGSTVVAMLEIPPGREHATWAALQLMMAGFAIVMIGTPYRALLLAHQDLMLVAAADLLESVLRLTAIVLTMSLNGDRLVLVSALIALALLVPTSVQGGLALWKFPEARPGRGRVRREHLTRLLRFGWWDLLMMASWRTRLQGVQLVLNRGFGSAANAAYNLAVHLGMLQNNVASALQRVSQPAVVANEAAGDRATVHRLVLVTSKYMLLLMSPLLIPILLETDELLRLWLGGPPPALAPSLVQLVAGWVFLAYAGTGHHMAAQATGHYRGYALWTFGLDAGALTLGGVWALALNGPAWALPLCTLIAVAVGNVVRAAYIAPIIGLPVVAWLRRTILPVLIAVGAGLVAALAVRRAMPAGPARLAMVTLAYGMVMSGAAWTVALQEWERAHFKRLLGHARLMVIRRKRRA